MVNKPTPLAARDSNRRLGVLMTRITALMTGGPTTGKELAELEAVGAEDEGEKDKEDSADNEDDVSSKLRPMM